MKVVALVLAGPSLFFMAGLASEGPIGQSLIEIGGVLAADVFLLAFVWWVLWMTEAS
jgi:hypothetical protein